VNLASASDFPHVSHVVAHRPREGRPQLEPLTLPFLVVCGNSLGLLRGNVLYPEDVADNLGVTFGPSC
jgi:hypothetical protein